MVKLKDITSFAKKSGAENIEFSTMWHGFEVYIPTYKDGKAPIIGPPQFILVSGENIKWAGADEAFEILDFLIKTEIGGNK
jgi:hypothetical protein